jgi:glutaminase
VEAIVREAYEKFRGDTEGKSADYIPYLAQVDSKMFGIAVVSTDNQIVESGKSNIRSRFSPSQKSIRSRWRWKKSAQTRCSRRSDRSQPAVPSTP